MWRAYSPPERGNMKKKVYEATYKGITLTRTTHNDYTHMVAAYYKSGDSAELVSMGWCSRLDLAERLLRGNERIAVELVILPAVLRGKTNPTSAAMHKYGYSSGIMQPLGLDAAIAAFEGSGVYLLYADDTEALAETEAEIIKHFEKGGIAGVERGEKL